MKIAIDAMGGDYAPRAAVEGAVLAARELGLRVVLVGDRAKLEKELAEHERAGLDLVIEHAAEVVTMEDSPLESILAKHDSSMHVMYELLKRGEVEAVVSAGNSGAMMAGAMIILGNLPGVDRPAIASLVPSSNGMALLIDAGANTDVKPFNLVQFAVMGHLYARYVMKLGRPRVGILSNGEEASKGTEVTRTAAEALVRMSPDINYIGYVEGRDINTGKVDVIVTDGFTGNVALKTMEGFAQFALGTLRDVFTGGIRGRLAYLLARKGLSAMRARFDKSEYGGAPLLGVNGVAIIAHGSSNARAIRNALRAAGDQALVRQVNPAIVEMLRIVPIEAPVKGKGVRALFNRMRERLQRHPKDADQSKKVQPPTPIEPSAAAEPLKKPTGPLTKRDDEKLKLHQAEHPLAEATQQPGNGATAPKRQATGGKPVEAPSPPSDESHPAKR